MSWTYEYPRPALTADCVLFGFTDSELQLLLIERAHNPFAGCWALPGGFVDLDETTDEAAHRELQEETGISEVPLTPLGAWSGVDREPRDRIVSVADWGLVETAAHQPQHGIPLANYRSWRSIIARSSRQRCNACALSPA